MKTLLSLTFCSLLAWSPTQDAVPERLAVAFLGHRGHHVPWERCQAALAPLRARGISVLEPMSAGFRQLASQTLTRH